MNLEGTRLSDILLKAKGKSRPDPLPPRTGRAGALPSQTAHGVLSRGLQPNSSRPPQPATAALPETRDREVQQSGSTIPNVPKNSLKMSVGHWTKEEHNNFLDVVTRDGWCWKEVSAAVPSRTPAQVRSHAQKYFSRLERERQALARPADESPPPRVEEGSSNTSGSISQLSMSRSPSELPPNTPQTSAHGAPSPPNSAQPIPGEERKPSAPESSLMCISALLSVPRIGRKRHYPEARHNSRALAYEMPIQEVKPPSLAPALRAESIRSSLVLAGRSLKEEEVDSLADYSSPHFHVPDPDHDASALEEGIVCLVEEPSYRFSPRTILSHTLN